MATEISSWPELVTHLEGGYAEVRVHAGERLRLTLRHDGRETPVGAYALRAASETRWLALAIKLAPAAQLRPRPALLGSAALPFGSIALLADFAIVRQALPLEGLRTDHLDHTLLALARLAVTLAPGAESRHAYLYR